DGARRAGERTVGAATANKRAWTSFGRGPSRQRPRLSTHDCAHRTFGVTRQPIGERTLSFDPLKFGTEIFYCAFGGQGVASGTATSPGGSRHNYPAEPHPNPGGATLHRLRPRGREASGKTPDVMSGCVQVFGRRDEGVTAR